MEIVTLQQLKNANEIQEKNNSLKELVKSEEVKGNWSNLPLAFVKESTYQNPAQDTLAQQIQNDLTIEKDASSIQREMVVLGKRITAEDLSQVEKEGYNPWELSGEEFVTIADKIKLQLAKAGKDISMMGGLSAQEIESMTGSVSLANSIEKALTQGDLPTDEVIVDDAVNAWNCVQEIAQQEGSQLSLETMKQLMKQEVEPTIYQLYRSVFAGGTTETVETVDINELGMKDRVEQVILNADLPVNEKIVKDCQWMISQEIPFHEDMLIYYQKLQQLNPEEIAKNPMPYITKAVANGVAPMEALVIEDNPITTQRLREETRLIMSIRANLAWMKQGITIDTKELQGVVEQLKLQEEQCIESMLETEHLAGEKEMAEKPETLRFHYYETIKVIEELSAQKEMVAHEVLSAPEKTIRQIHARIAYEKGMTIPRADLGDNMKKAFENIPELLNQIGLEPSKENQDAVRSLAYQQIEISKENVLRGKEILLQVKGMFEKLKPQVVLSMIREGFSPLDETVERVTQKAKEILNQQEQKTGENYAKFLYELEQQQGITKEERDSYIGIYRLIHQVEAGDGAAIGALLSTGVEVTMRNLLTAVRSDKQKNMEVVIDEKFGGLEDLISSELSIIQQIEQAYHQECLTVAKEELASKNLTSYENPEKMWEMTPEQLAKSLESLEQKEEQTYIEHQRIQLQQAFSSSQEIYRMLERYELPITPGYLLAANKMVSQRGKVFSQLQDSLEQLEDDFEVNWTQMFENLMKEFGESLKTPEDMAKAQHQLEELAENAMRQMIVSKEVSSMDLENMKLVMTQLSTMNRMAQKEEVYHLPIQVADETGNLTLKIVRGTEDKGLVSIALSTEKLGTLTARFQFNQKEFQGDISCEERQVQQAVERNKKELEEYLEKQTGITTSISCQWQKEMNLQEIYQETKMDFQITEERESVMTKTLYQFSQGFIQGIKDVVLEKV